MTRFPLSDEAATLSSKPCIQTPSAKVGAVFVPLCVPKTSSVLIARPNRLNVSRMNRAALLPPDPARLAQQAENEVDERVHRVVVLQIH